MKSGVPLQVIWRPSNNWAFHTMEGLLQWNSTGSLLDSLITIILNTTEPGFEGPDDMFRMITGVISH